MKKFQQNFVSSICVTTKHYSDGKEGLEDQGGIYGRGGGGLEGATFRRALASSSPILLECLYTIDENHTSLCLHLCPSYILESLNRLLKPFFCMQSRHYDTFVANTAEVQQLYVLFLLLLFLIGYSLLTRFHLWFVQYMQFNSPLIQLKRNLVETSPIVFVIFCGDWKFTKWAGSKGKPDFTP